MWQFNDDGNLKGYAEKHNDYIKKLMLRRGLLIPEDTLAQSGKIMITGPARSRLRIKEHIPTASDSLALKELFMNFKNRPF
ncbi:hypothetical protein D3C87_172530 [compost metagenome]